MIDGKVNKQKPCVKSETPRYGWKMIDITSTKSSGCYWKNCMQLKAHFTGCLPLPKAWWYLRRIPECNECDRYVMRWIGLVLMTGTFLRGSCLAAVCQTLVTLWYRERASAAGISKRFRHSGNSLEQYWIGSQATDFKAEAEDLLKIGSRNWGPDCDIGIRNCEAGAEPNGM